MLTRPKHFCGGMNRVTLTFCGHSGIFQVPHIRFARAPTHSSIQLLKANMVAVGRTARQYYSVCKVQCYRVARCSAVSRQALHAVSSLALQHKPVEALAVAFEYENDVCAGFGVQ